MPKFIMLVGIPASGKDTWAREYIKNHPYTVIHSSDDIREELYDNASCQESPAKVFELMRSRTLRDLRAGKDVIYNATNVSVKDRKGILNEIRHYFGEEIYTRALVFSTPLEICKEWNQKRERTVPDFVYEKMLSRWQTPFYGEGFDNIEIINPAENTYNKKTYWREIAEKVKNFGSQKNPHHSLTLWEHCDKCGKIAFEKYGSQFPSLAAAIHDYGKIYTQSFDEAGIAHYYQHENFSGYLALSMGFQLEVAQLVNYHMLCYNYKGGEAAWQNRLGEELWKKLEMLHDCDVLAH